MRTSNVALLLTTFALWVSGCATQADLQAVQQERDALRTQAADNRAALDSVRREIEHVRGEVEEIRYRLDRVARERSGASPQLKLLEDRIATLEKQVSTYQGESAIPTITGEPHLPEVGEMPLVPGTQPLPPSSDTLTGTTGADPGGSPLANESLEAQDDYRLALRAVQERQYDKAIQQFRTFQRAYPDSPMADDAQYWIGESYFLQNDYNRAILEFNDVLKYRRGDKVPAALMRQAQAFLEIGDKTDARLILQKLINDHPNSEQAQEAKDRLQALGR